MRIRIHTASETMLIGCLRQFLGSANWLFTKSDHAFENRKTSSFACALAIALVSGSVLAHASQAAITLKIDATDVSHGIEHAQLTIPVQPGPLTLAYPKWIPGEHAANGPITQLVSLHMTADGREVTWRRDSLDPFLFHLVVPSGVSTLNVQFDYLAPPKAFGDGFGKTPNVTPHLLSISFNHFILYPSAAAAASLVIKPQITLPEGWKFDCALTPEKVEGSTVILPPTSLYRLVDSPLVAGEYFRSIPVTGAPSPTRISIIADSPEDLAITDATVAGTKKLVAEANALFGSPHYRQYVWLMVLGNTLELNGVEHHESTEIRDAESLFTDADRMIESRVIPHEFVHSWNGKYRRPDGLANRNYQDPMVDDLLWVYEGMTRYWADLVLRTRSGMATPEQSRDYLAWVAATMDKDRPGRTWRSLADTATGVIAYNEAPPEWGTFRRKFDYYDEMLLTWLDADTRIREATGGQKSLDDFSHQFFGGPDAVAPMRPYSRADIVSALSAVAPLDWTAFLASKVDAVNPRAPLDGITRSGWTLSYDDVANTFEAAREKNSALVDLSFSLGAWVKADGTVFDIVPGSPAYEAGIAPGMRLLAVGGHTWNPLKARAAIVAAESSDDAIGVVFEFGDVVKNANLSYHGGLRYPHLVRDPNKHDLLLDVLSPRAEALGPPAGH